MNTLRLTRLLHPSTLVGKLLWSILPVVVLSLFAVVISCYLVADEQIRQGVTSQVKSLAEQVATHVRTFQDRRRLDLETIAESRNLVDYHKLVDWGPAYAAEAKIERDRIGEQFVEFYKRIGVYELVAYCDLEGRPVAAVDNGEVWKRETHPDLDATELKALPTDKPFHASPIFVRGGQKRIIFAKHYRDAEGVVRGIIVLVCNLDSLVPVLEIAGVGKRGGAYVRDGRSKETIGRVPEHPSLLRAENRLQDMQLTVIVEASEEEFFGPLVFLRNLTILMSVLVTAAVTGLLITIVRRATRPINQLVIGTQRLAAGDLDYRFPLPPLRDLQSLAVGFNDMADNLKARSDSLQDRVNQLSALRMMEQTVIQGLDEESILRTTLKAVAKGLGFDRAGLYWVDAANGQIVGRYSHFNFASDFTEATFRKRSHPMGGDDILNRVIASRQPQLVKDPAHHGGVDMRYVREAGSGEFVLAPLCGQDHVFGVITADNWHTHRPLRESDRDGLMLFASAAGMAMENARLMSRVADSEARHRMVLENSPVAILGLSRDLKIVTWNRGAEAMFGYATQEVEGRPFASLLSDEGRKELDRLFTDLVRTGAVHDRPAQGRKSTGEPLDITISWGGKHHEFLANDEWAVVIRDVTDERKLQHQLILSEKLSGVGQLIAGIAHELNNPLQAVVGYAQLLAQSPKFASADRELNSLYRSAQRCRRIIDNLLLFVRQGDVRKKPASLRKVIDASVELLHHKLRTAHTEAVIALPESDLHVNANFQQLEQVFVNLLGNACDAMHDQPGTRRIEVRVESRDGRAAVRVTDNGPGIPHGARESIFEPFFTTKGEGLGTGLGLPLCKQIIEDHGGSLRLGASDESRTGAAFVFDLALCAPIDEPEPQRPEALARTPGRKVFLVDDEPEVRSLLKDVLEAQGHEVIAADSLETASQLAGQHRFDLAVSDVHLNDGYGPDLARRWAEWSDHPRPKFVFLTGDLVTESLESACSGVNAAVLQKPVDLREFRAAVAAALGSTIAPILTLNAEL